VTKPLKDVIAPVETRSITKVQIPTLSGSIPSPPKEFPSIPTPLVGGRPFATTLNSAASGLSATTAPFLASARHGARDATVAFAGGLQSTTNWQHRPSWMTGGQDAFLSLASDSGLPYHLTPTNILSSFPSYQFHHDKDVDDEDEDMAGVLGGVDSKPAAVPTTTGTSTGHAAGLNVTSLTHDPPMEAFVEEKPSNILWTPSNHQGAVVLSTLDGAPLVLLEGIETDVSELFRAGTIQATSLFGTAQQAKQMTTATAKNEAPAPAPIPTQLFPPGRKYSRWTDEEDDVLRKAVDKQGDPPIDWMRISRKYFRGMRTAQQCKNRWKKVRRVVLSRSSRLFVVGILLTL
jgi:hypothetical protein